MAIDLLLGSKWLRLISIYLPHSGYPLEDLYDCVQQITSLTMEAQDRRMSVLIGGDFNVSLQDHGARISLIRDLVTQFDLQVANGFHPDAHDGTWTRISADGSRRRIDFILCSRGLYPQL